VSGINADAVLAAVGARAMRVAEVVDLVAGGAQGPDDAGLEPVAPGGGNVDFHRLRPPTRTRPDFARTRS